MSQLKVLQVIDTLNIGGAERVLVNLSNLLITHGIDISVVQITTPGPLSAELHPDVRQFSLNRKYRLSPSAFIRLIRLIHNHTIVHVHMRYNFLYVMLACSLAMVNKKA